MQKSSFNLQLISVCFVGGCLGGLFNSLFVWLSAVSGLNSLLEISINPNLTPQWLYLRIVWGGLWGLLFCVPEFIQHSAYKRAIFFMLIPALVQLLIVFPIKLNKGFLGLELGLLTPLLVIIANFVWAYTTALWISINQKQI